MYLCAFFHLISIATPYNAPFSRTNVLSVIFLGFWILKEKGPLNRKSKRWPICSFGRSFIWDHFQRHAMHRFPEKKDPVSFLSFFLGTRVLKQKNLKDDSPAFLGVLSFGTICNAAQCTVSRKRYPLPSVIFYVFVFIRYTSLLKKVGKMNNLRFLAYFHLESFATPCNAPFSRKKVPSVIFRVFDCKGLLNKISEKWHK